MSKCTELGEVCVHCRRSVAAGSGLYVNRVPADTYDEASDTYFDGYACADCLEPDVEDLCSTYCKQPDCVCDNLSQDAACDDCAAGQHVI